MNVEPKIAFLSGLFVYVMTAVFIGTIDAVFNVLDDNTMLIISSALGLSTFLIAIWKHK